MPEETVYSPESVTSIVWDFRGLDTLFETMVFYLAIIGSIALARGYKLFMTRDIDWEKLGLSPIVKTVTRLTAPLIVVVAISIALHGHLTPGGGVPGWIDWCGRLYTTARYLQPILSIKAWSQQGYNACYQEHRFDQYSVGGSNSIYHWAGDRCTRLRVAEPG
jgi:hypothetical protein